MLAALVLVANRSEDRRGGGGEWMLAALVLVANRSQFSNNFSAVGC